MQSSHHVLGCAGHWLSAALTLEKEKRETVTKFQSKKLTYEVHKYLFAAKINL